MKKKFLSLVLALVMLLSLVACGNKNEPATDPVDPPPVEDDTPDTPDTPDEPTEVVNYTELPTDDNEVYDMVFGEFYEAYMAAKEEADPAKHLGLMAIAEAKMLEAGVMIPKQANGGTYGLTRVTPYTVSPVLWGQDQYHFEYTIICNEPIKSEDYAEMKKIYGECETDAEYRERLKAFMAENGYTQRDSYMDIGEYRADPETWDILATSKTGDSEFITKTVCNLLRYDGKNVAQPAAAVSWEESADHLKYTFKIREGQVWVDSQGRKVADVVADDWVAGFQHMLDAMGGLEFLVDGIVVGVTEYINGDTTDFSTVGVKALDEYTLEYTLTKPTPYFTTVMNYGLFAPMSRSYFESQGGKFGEDYDPAAETYLYGKDPNHIAYNGAFLMTNYTSKNVMVFQANENFWNYDNMEIHTLTHQYDDGSDPMRSYNAFMAADSLTNAAGLGPSQLEQAKKDTVTIDGVEKTVFDAYQRRSNTDATSFMGFFNLNRKAFANYNDASKCVSTQTPEENQRTHAALLNQHFRMALVTGLDRGMFNAQRNGEELKFSNIINSYTPGDFLKLTEDLTIDINGQSMSFPAGTNYGEIMQAQIDADGFPITVWDPAGNDGAGSSTGFDGWYNLDYANQEMALAVEELAAMGLEISPENPIQIDITYVGNSEVFTNCAHIMEQCWNAVGGGVVKVNLVACANQEEWYDTGYNPATGAEMNFDYTDVSGWGPDYGDPASFLDTLLPDGAGYMAKNFGLF